MRRVPLPLLAVAAALAGTAAPAAAADPCPNAAYRTGAGASLPECRAWERVSPVDKNGQNVANYGSTVTTGDRAIYNAAAGFEDVDAVPLVPVEVSKRGADWTTRGVDAPFLNTTNLHPHTAFAYSGDLTSAMVLSNYKLTPDANERGTNFYVRDLDTGGYRLAFTRAEEKSYVRLTALRDGDELAYASTGDLEHFAFLSPTVMAAGAIEDGSNLYQWDGGDLKLASVLPDGSAVNVNGGRGAAEKRRYSEDGRRLTMELQAPTANAIYQRVDGSKTVLVSRSHRAGATRTEPVSASGVWASPDGKEVTFTDVAGPLTNESPADGAARLYRWHADDDSLDDLLVGVVPADQPTYVNDVLQVSRDGRYVWFLAQSALRPGTEEFRSNVYVLDTATSRLSFVGAGLEAWFNRAGTRMAAVSERGLLTFDAATPEAGTTCVTCAIPGATSPVRIGNAGGYFQISGARPHPITDDGRVFFDTPDRLVPEDANGVGDVYEYLPGRGVALITSGTGSRPARFNEVGPSGDDVLFSTAEPLVGTDTDDLVDLYDARVGGGLATQLAAPAATTCQGDACRGPVAPGAGLASPASPAPVTRATPAFTLRAPSAAARKAAARRGRLRIEVRSTVPGKAVVRATARLGGRTRAVAASARTLRRAGVAAVTLRLSKRARRALRRTGRLRLTMSATFSTVAGRQTVSATLRRPTTTDRGGAR